MTDENTLTISPEEFAKLINEEPTRLFQQTQHLRFVKRDVPAKTGTMRTETILQQLWADAYSPDKEWRDVPVEEEE